jgi:hypothetical protein
MRKTLFLVVLIVGLIMGTGPAQAAAITLSLDTSFPGEGKPDPDGDPPWLTAVFDDKNTSGSVFLTLTASLGYGTDYQNYVSEWYFNLDPNFDPDQLRFSVVGDHSAPSASDIYTGRNTEKADGDGYFDIKFNFPTSAGGRFDDSDSITYEITSTPKQDIVASSFYFLSEPGGDEDTWYSAAHIQELSGEAGSSSTWIGAPVPIPGGIWLLGSGLLALTGFRFRSRYRKGCL